jgi:RHS repeat-associated protein
MKMPSDTGLQYSDNGEASWVGREPGGNRRLSLAWDALGLLRGASDGEVGGQTYASHQFTYAPSGLRIRDKRTAGGIGIASHDRRFAYTTSGTLLSVWETSNMFSSQKKTDVVYANGEAVIEIVMGGSVHDSPGSEKIFELHNDYLGSPRYITDGTPNSPTLGRIIGEQAFGPYGERMEGSFVVGGTPSAPILKDLPWGYKPITGYTGHVNEDMTGLIYMRGRYYSPAWHRFVNSDQGVDPLSVNQFAYVGGMPFMATDPSGMAWKDIRDTFQQSQFPEIEALVNAWWGGDFKTSTGWIFANTYYGASWGAEWDLIDKMMANYTAWLGNKAKNLNYADGHAVEIIEVERPIDDDYWVHYYPLVKHKALIFIFNGYEDTTVLLFEAGKDGAYRFVDPKVTSFGSEDAAMNPRENLAFKVIRRWQPRLGITRENVFQMRDNWQHGYERYNNFNMFGRQGKGADCWDFVKYGLKQSALWWWSK